MSWTMEGDFSFDLTLPESDFVSKFPNGRGIEGKEIHSNKYLLIDYRGIYQVFRYEIEKQNKLKDILTCYFFLGFLQMKPKHVRLRIFKKFSGNISFKDSRGEKKIK